MLPQLGINRGGTNFIYTEYLRTFVWSVTNHKELTTRRNDRGWRKGGWAFVTRDVLMARVDKEGTKRHGKKYSKRLWLLIQLDKRFLQCRRVSCVIDSKLDAFFPTFVVDRIVVWAAGPIVRLVRMSIVRLGCVRNLYVVVWVSFVPFAVTSFVFSCSCSVVQLCLVLSSSLPCRWWLVKAWAIWIPPSCTRRDGHRDTWGARLPCSPSRALGNNRSRAS